jgi:predicted amidohydrolase
MTFIYVPLKSQDENVKKLYNTHVMVDDRGDIQGTYCKTHMFDLDIPGKIRLCESDYTIPGNQITPPIESPVGKIALGIVSSNYLIINSLIVTLAELNG